jgi:hypothetical protein
MDRENLAKEVPTPESILLMGTIASEEKQRNKKERWQA